MIRRDAKLFARCLLTAVTATVILAAILTAAVQIYTDGGKKLYTPVRVAVVDNEDSMFSRILVHAVGESEFIDGLLDVVRMERGEAESALKNGEISAAMILPEGYITDIMHGERSEGTIIIAPELSAQREIVASIAKMGETLLLAGQNGVFGGESLMREHGVGGDIWSRYYDDVNTRLLREALTANERYFTVTVLDYCETGVSETEYYVICWTSMLALFVSVFFIPLFATDCETALLRRLCVCGVSSGRFLLPKLALTFIYRCVVIGAVIAAAGALGLNVPSVPAAVAAAAAAALFTTVAGSCAAFCFGNGIAVSFIVAAGGLVLCGGLVPRQLLPDAVTFIGDISPFGAAKALLAPAFGAPADAAGIALAVAYAAASLILLCAKVRRVREGGARSA